MSRSPQTWPLEELVRAQCLACEGRSYDEIAQVLGRSRDEVRRKLDGEAPPARQEFANVAYRHLKKRR